MAYAGNDLDNYIYALTQKVRGIGYKVDEEVKKNGGRWFLLPLKQRLFNKGIDGAGNKLPDYTEAYTRRKRQYGYRARPTNLKFFGNWYNSMFVKSQNGVIEILTNSSAKDEPEKTEYLIDKYGEDILTLTVDEQEVVAKKLADNLKLDWDKLKIPEIKFTIGK